MSEQTQTLTPEQLEELIQFAKTANCIAENLAVTALQWVPQIFNHLPASETDIAEDAAKAIAEISQFLKDLTKERIALRKAGVRTVV